MRRLAAVSASFRVARVGDAGALEVGGLDPALLGEGLDLDGGPVHEHGADAERPQHRHVHQDVAEVLVGDDRAVHGDHERLLAELGDVLEDAPEVGRSHAGNGILGSPHRQETSHERERLRIFATCDIGKEALDRLRAKGWEVEVYPGPQPPPKELVLAKAPLGDRRPPHDAA